MRLAERDAIESLNGATRGAILRALPELTEVGAVELVRLPELVEEPDDLAWVADGVRRKLRRNDEVDGASVGFFEIEEPPHERLAEDALAGIPLVRNGDVVDLVVAGAELGDEVVGEDLCAAAGERHLRTADGDPHREASRGTRPTNGIPPLPPTDSLGRKVVRVCNACVTKV